LLEKLDYKACIFSLIYRIGESKWTLIVGRNKK